jgi:hypothetical protein
MMVHKYWVCLTIFFTVGVSYSLQAKEPEKKPEALSLNPMDKATELKPGPILDMYLINDDNDDNKGPSLEASDNISMGTIVDNGSLFELGAFSADPSLSTYVGHNVGVMWTGFLKIEEDAPHLVSLELQKDAAAEAKGYLHCLTEVSINGKNILKIDAGGFRNVRKFANNEKVLVPETTNLKLKAGYYPASVWLACTPVDVSKVRVKLKLRSPADRVLRELGPEDFLRRE